MTESGAMPGAGAEPGAEATDEGPHRPGQSRGVVESDDTASVHPMQEAAAEVLKLLAKYGGAELDLLSDEQLNLALDPFRRIRPLAAQCGLEGCSRTISW